MKYRLRHWRPLLICALCLCSAVGSAEEDAGLRSVFAEGAGCRALGLGDAGAALPDDGSVLFRNPGALGLLPRLEVQAGHSNLIGLGFGEQYFSITVPSWRWGVVALGYRHFGVGGIEERNEFNHLVADDLSDSEMQISLAYGKAFSGAWSLGGALKLRRQELAGLVGNGIGLDLGVFLKPARILGREEGLLRFFNLGIALRNAVEPAIKLDQVAVPDPGSLRIGLACVVPIGRGQRITGVVDLERVAEMSARLQAGLEYRIQMLSLRAGYLRDHMTAGVGLTWNDMTCDYTWEDNELEQVHRFGVNLHFGQTVSERRQAVLDAEDAALHRQLEETFNRRQRERIERLIAESEEAIDRRDFELALSTLSTVNALDPDNEKVTGLSALAHLARAELQEGQGKLASAEIEYRRSLTYAPGYQRALAGLARCQAESDRLAVRSEELRLRFSAAMDAFTEDRLIAASTIFAEILQTRPDDAEAAAMLVRIRQVIDQRIPVLLERAQDSIRAESFDRAEGHLDQVNAYDPAHPELERLRNSLAEARLAATQRRADATATSIPVEQVSPAPAKRELSTVDRRELADLYSRGQNAATAGRMDEALHYWELVWAKAPDYQQVAGYLLDEYLMRGMEVFAEGRLEDAVELWQQALRIDVADERALGYLARANEQLAHTREILND
ncbi:MAG: hypothetical protein GY835_01100 [bacterium]|nr:hypothetical protein [bacterium]